VEPLADHDDLLLTTYLAERPMTAERVRGELAEQTRTGQVHPVFFGSAITGAGVAELTSGIVALLPTAGGDVDAEPWVSVFNANPLDRKEYLLRVTRRADGWAGFRSPLDGSAPRT
jgi:translation elongation factor EF-G